MKQILILLFIISVSKFNALSQCYSAGENLPNTGFILQGSGYDDLDEFVQKEIKSLEDFYGVNIDFFFLLEDFNKNAMFTPTCTHSCRGTVFLGIKMLYSELKKNNGDYTLKAILAHEFGHCVQHINNWNEPGKRPELFSDFMSGYYMGKKYDLGDNELNSLFSSFFSMGDRQYWSPSHHGTGTERQCSFLEGYYFAKENSTNVKTAANYAFEYVKADNPCGVRKYKAVEKVFNNDQEKSNKIKSNNYGRNTIQNLSINDRNPIKITFFCSDKKYHTISAPGIGVCGTITSNQQLTLIMDKNTNYKLWVHTFRRNLFGKQGSLKSASWRNLYSPNKDIWIDLSKDF